MLFCQISHKLVGSIIQEGWQKIIMDKTWSPLPSPNYWWWMPARRGQNMQKGHPLVRDMLGTCQQPNARLFEHFLQLLLTSTLSSLTPTFLWLYWSALTMSVWMNECSVNPSSPHSTVPSETGLRAAASRLRPPCGMRSFLLRGDCGFWSINNGLQSFASIECRCAKIEKAKWCNPTINQIKSKHNKTSIDLKNQTEKPKEDKRLGLSSVLN